MGDIVIKFDQVSKKFCRSLRHGMWYGVEDIGRSMFGMNSRTDQLRHKEFWAVDNVNFEIEQGDSLGIIGENGSGKSTLLKLLNGIFMPDKGRIEIIGSVGALIEVGAGFHPLLTGRENVYINGTILGMNKKEIDKRFDTIVDFAELWDFIDTPVKYYSNGMYVRLGFAVAAYSDPDILLVDEVLSVGDATFQRKCLNRFKSLREQNKTIVFVSHNLFAVQGICNRVIYLQRGSIRMTGTPDETITTYEADIREKERNKYDDLTKKNLQNTLSSMYKGSGEVEIQKIHVLDLKSQASKCFQLGEAMIVSVEYIAYLKIKQPVFSIGVVRADNFSCCGINTRISKVETNCIEGPGAFEAEIQMQVIPGIYYIHVLIWDEGTTLPYDHRRSEAFTVESHIPNIDRNYGVFIPDVRWRKV